jgi:hypothetical protein
MALMGYFEARKGRFAFFTDVIWGDLTFDTKRRFTPDVGIPVGLGADLQYQTTIIQSGVAYEIANWSGPASHTALDVLGGARYWNQEADISLDIALGDVRDRMIVRSGVLEWVDPFIGARIRHQLASGSELVFEGDVGGFGAGSDFSWQALGTYAFDMNCFGTPLRTVVGYRALAVDYSTNGRFGQNTLDIVQHGPVMGVKFRW